MFITELMTSLASLVRFVGEEIFREDIFTKVFFFILTQGIFSVPVFQDKWLETGELKSLRGDVSQTLWKKLFFPPFLPFFFLSLSRSKIVCKYCFLSVRPTFLISLFPLFPLCGGGERLKSCQKGKRENISSRKRYVIQVVFKFVREIKAGHPPPHPTPTPLPLPSSNHKLILYSFMKVKIPSSGFLQKSK